MTVGRLRTSELTSNEARTVSWNLPAEVHTAARARLLTRETLAGWGATDPSDTDDVVLIVDELVTNAVVHGRGPVRLLLRLEGPRLLGEVGDDGDAPPSAGEPRPDAETGRGLWLVRALATDFGIRPEATGKTLWFARRLAVADGFPESEAESLRQA